MQGFRKDNPDRLLPEPGQYGRDALGDWFGMTPNGHLAGLALHNITEHADGTITVKPSILVRNEREELWHGYLTQGVWQSC